MLMLGNSGLLLFVFFCFCEICFFCFLGRLRYDSFFVWFLFFLVFWLWLIIFEFFELSMFLRLFEFLLLFDNVFGVLMMLIFFLVCEGGVRRLLIVNELFLVYFWIVFEFFDFWVVVIFLIVELLMLFVLFLELVLLLLFFVIRFGLLWSLGSNNVIIDSFVFICFSFLCDEVLGIWYFIKDK